MGIDIYKHMGMDMGIDIFKHMGMDMGIDIYKHMGMDMGIEKIFTYIYDQTKREINTSMISVYV